MVSPTFSDAALVLVGHGSTLDEGSGAAVFQHAAELRRRGLFAEVREGFWKQDPPVTRVAAELRSPRVFLVPLFMSEGYFSEEVIPQALGFRRGEPGRLDRVQRLGSQEWVYCRPVGMHPGMTRVILDRAVRTLKEHPFPRAPRCGEVTLMVAGHGTEQSATSRKSVERQVELLRAEGLFAAVHAVFMEEAPRIADGFGLVQTRNVVVVPFFIGDGLHVRQDIPVLLGEPERIVRERLRGGLPTWRNPTEKQGRLVWYAPSVGRDPLMAEVILDLVREAAGGPFCVETR